MFATGQSSSRSESLMNVIDQINRKMGRESIKLASEGFFRPWKMKQENKSLNCTTDWNEILLVN
jgi:DNA polymerase V